MKRYYSPSACSLTDHIALHEAGLSFDREEVDPKAKTTEKPPRVSVYQPEGLCAGAHPR